MFHDMGLLKEHSSAHERFEVDGANVARDFLRGHGITQQDIHLVWTAIALHATPGIPQHMYPVMASETLETKKPSLRGLFQFIYRAKKKGPLKFKGPFKLVARARFELATFGL